MVVYIVVFVVGVLVGGFGGYKYGAAAERKGSAAVSAILTK